MLDAIKNHYGVMVLTSAVLFAVIYFLAWLGARSHSQADHAAPINCLRYSNTAPAIKAPVTEVHNVISNVRWPINY